MSQPQMLREYWYVGCASTRLGAAPRAARVLDQDLVLFRDPQGTASALLDRCCHRGVRLSLGRITDGNLACGYHGWQYDGRGECVHVPSLPLGAKIPRPYRVRAFPCCEQDGYVWVWMGTKPPDPESPPAVAEFARYGWTQGVSNARCSATMLIENQFDCAHPTFAHVGTHPVYFANLIRGFQETEFEIRISADGITSFFPTAPCAAAPIPESVRSITRFVLPCQVLVHQRARQLDFLVVLHIVPTGPNTCRMEWLQRMKAGSSPGVSWIEEETRLIEQDRLLLESAQPWYDTGEDFEHHVPADGITVLIRRAMALAAADRWSAEWQQLPRRQLVRYRG
jgi:nitrite reductase/ring-hydroxylating ferredoxin subunit